MSRRLRSRRFEPLAELRRRLGLTGSFCERVAVFPRRHRLGLRPGPLGLVCHSIFKRNGVRDLAYLHDGSLLAERESNWRDHVPERKDRPAGCSLSRWNLRLPGRIGRYRHNETISTRRSRDAGITTGGTNQSRNLDCAISGIRTSFRKACSSPRLSPNNCRRQHTAID
jgi:hypothetical protein